MIKKNRIPDVMKATEAAKKTALQAAVVFVHGEAVLRAPVDSGNLKNSLAYDVQGDEGRVGTNVEYGPYVEQGTSKQGAQPYLRPAVDENIPQIKSIISDILRSAIEGAAR